MGDEKPTSGKKISLAPLSFDEAVDGLLKVKPPEKAKAPAKPRQPKKG